MVTSDEAAFRVLEIVAILFPLLLIVFQVFARHLLDETSTLATELSEYLGFFAVAAVVLTTATVGASMQLMSGNFSLVIYATVGVLYSGMSLIGLSIGFMGRQLQNLVAEQAQQVDLTQSVPDDQVETEEVANESSE